jgi:hypothetical protein
MTRLLKIDNDPALEKYPLVGPYVSQTRPIYHNTDEALEALLMLNKLMQGIAPNPATREPIIGNHFRL